MSHTSPAPRERLRLETIGLEPKGCPTPGACSALAELADLKQRLLPQFAGRTQRAEHERDALLEQLIAARSATEEPVAWMYEENGENMFGHHDGYRPKDAVPLYAGSPPVEVGATVPMPVELTQEMWEAARDQMPDGHANIDEIYRAMLTAYASPMKSQREREIEKAIGGSVDP